MSERIEGSHLNPRLHSQASLGGRRHRVNTAAQASACAARLNYETGSTERLSTTRRGGSGGLQHRADG